MDNDDLFARSRNGSAKGFIHLRTPTCIAPNVPSPTRGRLEVEASNLEADFFQIVLFI